jgi:hypothetical protein
MPKREVTTDSIRRPVGVFSQATTCAGSTSSPRCRLRPWVEVTKMVSPDYLIEINAIAVITSK